jgi:4-hydroxy-3-methylbut-2-enyl diphosphate reductase
LQTITDYLPNKSPIKILVTSGASCPDAAVEAVIKKIASFYNLEDQVDLKNVVNNA